MKLRLSRRKNRKRNGLDGNILEASVFRVPAWVGQGYNERRRERFSNLFAAVNFGPQHADIREVAVALREIEAVADDELIGHFKPDVVHLHIG